MSSEFPYAGFWIRVAARLVDLGIILGIYTLFNIVDRLGADVGLWPSAGLLEEFSLTDPVSAENTVRLLFFLSFPVFYYVYLHGAYGQTFGKMAFRIKVVNEDGTPLTYGRAFLRWLGYFLCDLTLNVGYILVAFDKRKQGLHDKACRTVVVRLDAPPTVPGEGKAGSSTSSA